MSLLQKLKSVFGLGDEDGDESRRDVGVTVEREPGESDEPATETESAVKGADVDATAGKQPERPKATADETTTEENGEPAAPETADEAIEEAEPEADETEEAEAEPSEEPEAETDAEPETETDAEPETELEEESETEQAAETESESEPEEPEGTLEDIKGVGPAYAERLRNAGVGSIAELAEADADELAEETDLSATRIENWIEQAKVR